MCANSDSCLHQTLRSQAAETEKAKPLNRAHMISLRVSNNKLLHHSHCQNIAKATLRAMFVRYARRKWGWEVVCRVASRRIARAPVSSWVVKRNCTWRKRHFLPLCTAAKIIELSLHDAMTDYCYSRKYPGVYSTSRALHHSRYSAICSESALQIL